MLNDAISTKAKKVFSLLTVAAAAVTASACGSEAEKALTSNDGNKKDTLVESERTTDVELGVVQADKGFNLAAPTTNDFVIAISACSSEMWNLVLCRLTRDSILQHPLRMTL